MDRPCYYRGDSVQAAAPSQAALLQHEGKPVRHVQGEAAVPGLPERHVWNRGQVLLLERLLHPFISKRSGYDEYRIRLHGQQLLLHPDRGIQLHAPRAVACDKRADLNRVRHHRPKRVHRVQLLSKPVPYEHLIDHRNHLLAVHLQQAGESV